MKILALTDIHGSYDTAVNIIENNTADVIIIGGDLTTVGSVKEAEDAVTQFQRHSATVFCVAGNMDLPQHDDLFVRLGVSINGRGVIVHDVGFFGVSAAPYSRLHTPYEISEEEISKRVEAGYRQVQRCRTKIFVPHAPPYGTRIDIVHSGIHVGSTAVRDFVENEKPDVVICGHIHESRGQDILGRTKIVNCGAAAAGYFVTITIEESIAVENKRYTS